MQNVFELYMFCIFSKAELMPCIVRLLSRASSALHPVALFGGVMGISNTLRIWAKRIKRDGVTLWFAGKHPKTPWYAKALGLFVVAYALSPID